MELLSLSNFAIYIKNNAPDEGIVIEDKTDPEKNSSHEFKSTEIFKASDMMVDTLTKLLKQTQNERDVAIANRQTTRQLRQGKQNRKRWADGTVCN